MGEHAETGPAVMPLDVMLELMRERWESGDKAGAAALARLAAPYTHKRPAKAAAPAAKLLSRMTDAELDDAIARGEKLYWTAEERAVVDAMDEARRQQGAVELRQRIAWEREG